MDKRLLDVVIILLSFRESFILGLIVTGYVAYKTFDYHKLKQGSVFTLKKLEEDWQLKYNIVKRQLDTIFKVRQEENELDENFKKPAEMPFKVIPYNRCIIEDYDNGGYYLVLYPDMTTYPKMFYNVQHARDTIDRIVKTWKFEDEKGKRSTIQNVRLVK